MCGMLVGLAEPVAAEVVPCPDTRIAVDSDQTALHRRVCDVVAQALDQLGRCHLTVATPVSIAVRDRFDVDGFDGLAHYRPSSGKVVVLSPGALDAQLAPESAYRAVAPEALFDSLLVHELAHALSDQSPMGQTGCIADFEYVAYAMQLAFLDSADREAFLAAAGVDGPVPPGRFNDFVALAAPIRFAASAWLHFETPGNGCDFVGALLRRERTFRMDPE